MAEHISAEAGALVKGQQAVTMPMRPIDWRHAWEQHRSQSTIPRVRLMA